MQSGRESREMKDRGGRPTGRREGWDVESVEIREAKRLEHTARRESEGERHRSMTSIDKDQEAK